MRESNYQFDSSWNTSSARIIHTAAQSDKSGDRMFVLSQARHRNNEYACNGDEFGLVRRGKHRTFNCTHVPKPSELDLTGAGLDATRRQAPMAGADSPAEQTATARLSLAYADPKPPAGKESQPLRRCDDDG